MFLDPRGCLHPGMWCSAGWSTTGRTRLGRFIETSSTGMTWGLLGVGMRSTSWMRPGSPRRRLGICLLGGVFLVVFVRHLFLGDLFLLFSFLLWLFLWSCRFSFFLCCYICCVITVGFGFWVLVVLVVSCWFFLGAWKSWGFPLFLLLLYLVLFVFICFEYTELLPGWLTSEALLTRC